MGKTTKREERRTDTKNTAYKKALPHSIKEKYKYYNCKYEQTEEDKKRRQIYNQNYNQKQKENPEEWR